MNCGYILSKIKCVLFGSGGGWLMLKVNLFDGVVARFDAMC